MDNYTFYGICPVCGHVFTEEEISTTSSYICPVCGAVIDSGVSTLQTNNTVKD